MMYKNKETGVWEKGYPHSRHAIDKHGNRLSVFASFYRLRTRGYEYEYLRPSPAAPGLHTATEERE